MNAHKTDQNQPIIVAESVYKRFPRNEMRQRSLRHEATTMVKELLGSRIRNQPEAEPFYALRDVSFEINRGESVAIIGRNGSGKSTLLRVLTGITRPSSGFVEIRGSFTALIALGAGFKTHMTGRQNIYLNAAMYGIGPRQVDQIMDEIIEFSELQDFIDLPVTRYSSGMMARLGFSIAIHILPDVVLLDEVLAVGDVAFQEKCMDRILALKRDQKTIVFVSHAQSAVEKLCERSIWLHKGTLRCDGPTAEVFEEYNAFLHATT